MAAADACGARALASARLARRCWRSQPPKPFALQPSARILLPNMQAEIEEQIKANQDEAARITEEYVRRRDKLTKRR